MAQVTGAGGGLLKPPKPNTTPPTWAQGEKGYDPYQQALNAYRAGEKNATLQPSLALIAPPTVPGLMTQQQINQANREASKSPKEYLNRPKGYNPATAKPPAWLGGVYKPEEFATPFNSGSLPKLTPATGYDATPKVPPPPTDSFLASGGQITRTQDGLVDIATDPTQPTGTFFGGGGQYVQGPYGPVWVGPQGVNSFIGGGGEAMRGPDYPLFLPPPAAAAESGGGNGFGTNYGWGRGGGGGGGGYRPSDYLPPWYMNLYGWNFRG